MRRAPWLSVALTVAVASMLSSCGTGLRKQQAQQLAEADALFTRGCYSCLTKAFDAYEALRLAGYQPAEAAARAYDAAILLAAREKELAMPAEPWIERARGLAPRDPQRALYVEIVSALPWAHGRHDSDFTHAGRLAIGPELDALDRWEAALGPAAARPVTGAYLMAAARCAFFPARLHETLTFDALASAHANAPLMQYAAGICRPELRSHLDGLASDPDFHELLFQQARLQLFQGGATVQLGARVLLEAAREAMPALVANTYLLAGVLNTLEDYVPCAAMYAEVIAKGGARRQSLLNRTMCLTNAGKSEDAIASATELIDTPGILKGEGYYWRAANRYTLKALADARADVEAAKPLYDDAAVFALSGFIAYDMGQKDYAYTEFDEAFQRNRTYCTAPFYQGLMDAEKERWEPAATKYEVATGCYETSVRRLAFSLEQAEARDASDTTRERRIASLTRALDGERLQVAHAAYNVAYANGRLGRAGAAIPFAEKAAAAHKNMETLATELLAVLRKAG